MKQNFKIAEKKEIMKLNDKITYLSNEIEIKQSKIDYIDKGHKNLQLKYLKLLGNKRKMTQESLPVFKYNKEEDIDKISENNTTRGTKYVDNIKSNYSIKKNENFNIKNKNNINRVNNSKIIKNSQEMHLPDIKNRNNKKSLSLKNNVDKDSQKEIKSNALKDLNMLLSYFSEEDGENMKKKETLEEEDGEGDDNEEMENKDSS